MVLSWFKEKIEENTKKNEEARKKEEELERRIQTIELFPGSLEEYERMKGKSYEIIELEGARKYIEGWTEYFEHLKDSKGRPRRYNEERVYALNVGADALIRYTVVRPLTIGGAQVSTGIPVKRKGKQNE